MDKHLLNNFDHKKGFSEAFQEQKSGLATWTPMGIKGYSNWKPTLKPYEEWDYSNCKPYET